MGLTVATLRCLQSYAYNLKWLSCGIIPAMNAAKVVEVQMWNTPTFYLMIEWSKFRNLSQESQWETLLAFLKAGSSSFLGDDTAIHLKSFDDSWNAGEWVNFCVKNG